MPAVVDWSVREYRDSLEAMRELVRQRRSGAIGDTLILVEHPPVVTVGVEGDDGSAAASGLPTVHVERGGRATYHGPGQLVGYPIVDLSHRGRDVRRFVTEVEDVIVRSLSPFGVLAGHVSGRRGVWVAGERKIASIGIAVDHWVTFHGFALNVDPDLTAFGRFRPCGFDGSVMTSLAREVGRPLAIGQVAPHVIEAWNGVFGSGSEAGTESGARAESPPARA
jgi:lipoyl(octanoyl) transferase